MSAITQATRVSGVATDSFLKKTFTALISNDEAKPKDTINEAKDDIYNADAGRKENVRTIGAASL